MTRYLNYNSTFLGGNNEEFNPSDINYNENIELKIEEERIKNFLLNYVNAPDGSKVIFNSGASESIANMMVWAKSISPFGMVLGSSLDHPTIKANAENYDLFYSHINFDNMEIPNGTTMIFITGVSPSTGEIYPMNLKKYKYLNDEDYLSYISEKQIKPLKVLDASQMIGKIKIDMKKEDLNAVFFSTHKIGGNFNNGVLIVNDRLYDFKPLIAGNQQYHLRGGTYEIENYLNINYLLKDYEKQFNIDECKEIYKEITKELEKNEIKFYKPKLKHLYNTILIHLNNCNAKIIHDLAESGIYLGSSTACQSDNINKELRISYLNKSNFGKNTIKKICEIIKENEKEEKLLEDDEELDEYI